MTPIRKATFRGDREGGGLGGRTESGADGGTARQPNTGTKHFGQNRSPRPDYWPGVWTTVPNPSNTVPAVGSWSVAAAGQGAETATPPVIRR